jgi:hypothetical protein
MTNDGPAAPTPRREKWLDLLAVLFIVDFLVAVVMLVTDKNLQTDFGFQPRYYAHWYGVLAIGVLDLFAAISVLAVGSMGARGGRGASLRKYVVYGGLAWPILAILAMVGIVSAYSQVGFGSMSQFAQYLFGVTPYPGTLSYIPWLYDLMLVLFLVTAAVALRAVLQVRTGAVAPAVG